MNFPNDIQRYQILSNLVQLGGGPKSSFDQGNLNRCLHNHLQQDQYNFNESRRSYRIMDNDTCMTAILT